MLTILHGEEYKDIHKPEPFMNLFENEQIILHDERLYFSLTNLRFRYEEKRFGRHEIASIFLEEITSSSYQSKSEPICALASLLCLLSYSGIIISSGHIDFSQVYPKATHIFDVAWSYFTNAPGDIPTARMIMILIIASISSALGFLYFLRCYLKSRQQILTFSSSSASINLRLNGVSLNHIKAIIDIVENAKNERLQDLAEMSKLQPVFIPSSLDVSLPSDLGQLRPNITTASPQPPPLPTSSIVSVDVLQSAPTNALPQPPPGVPAPSSVSVDDLRTDPGSVPPPVPPTTPIVVEIDSLQTEPYAAPLPTPPEGPALMSLEDDIQSGIKTDPKAELLIEEHPIPYIVNFDNLDADLGAIAIELSQHPPVVVDIELDDSDSNTQPGPQPPPSTPALVAVDGVSPDSSPPPRVPIPATPPPIPSARAPSLPPPAPAASLPAENLRQRSRIRKKRLKNE